MRSSSTLLFGLIIGLLAIACGAAQMAGASINTNREFEITNKSKEPICSIDVVNLQNAVKGGADTTSTKTDVKPTETKVVKLTVAVDQDRTLRFKSCKGATIKDVNVPYAKDRAHVDVE